MHSLLRNFETVLFNRHIYARSFHWKLRKECLKYVTRIKYAVTVIAQRKTCIYTIVQLRSENSSDFFKFPIQKPIRPPCSPPRPCRSAASFRLCLPIGSGGWAPLVVHQSVFPQIARHGPTFPTIYNSPPLSPKPTAARRWPGLPEKWRICHSCQIISNKDIKTNCNNICAYWVKRKNELNPIVIGIKCKT